MAVVLLVSLLTTDCQVAFSAGNNDTLPDVLSAQQERIRVIEAAANQWQPGQDCAVAAATNS